MKTTLRYGTVMMLVMSLFLLGGCDMFRKMAGRPTSKDIERRKTEIARRQAAMNDKSADKAEADSLAILDALKGMNCKIKTLSEVGASARPVLDSGYYIIVGAFGRQYNIDAMLRSTSAAGYTPVIIPCKSGLKAVGVAPSGNLEDAFSKLKAVRKENFCPNDVWILANM